MDKYNAKLEGALGNSLPDSAGSGVRVNKCHLFIINIMIIE